MTKSLGKDRQDKFVDNVKSKEIAEPESNPFASFQLTDASAGWHPSAWAQSPLEKASHVYDLGISESNMNPWATKYLWNKHRVKQKCLTSHDLPNPGDEKFQPLWESVSEEQIWFDTQQSTAVDETTLHRAVKAEAECWKRNNAKKTIDAEVPVTPCMFCLGRAFDDASLVMCTSCDRQFHEQCLGKPLKGLQIKDWHCEVCRKGMPVCVVCHGNGNLVECDKCQNHFHLGCMDPPESMIYEEDWTCSFCKVCES